MTKRGVLKIVISVLIVITLIMIFSQNVFALNFDIGNKFDGTGDKSEAKNNISRMIGATINITQVIGAGLSILMLIILGIKWIYASPSGKAEISKNSKYYILGAIFIFAAVGLLQIVKTFTKGSIENQVI